MEIFYTVCSGPESGPISHFLLTRWIYRFLSLNQLISILSCSLQRVCCQIPYTLVFHKLLNWITAKMETVGVHHRGKVVVTERGFIMMYKPQNNCLISLNSHLRSLLGNTQKQITLLSLLLPIVSTWLEKSKKCIIASIRQRNIMIFVTRSTF